MIFFYIYILNLDVIKPIFSYFIIYFIYYLFNTLNKKYFPLIFFTFLDLIFNFAGYKSL